MTCLTYLICIKESCPSIKVEAWSRCRGWWRARGQSRPGAKLHRIPGWESRCRPDPPVVFLLIALNCWCVLLNQYLIGRGISILEWTDPSYPEGALWDRWFWNCGSFAKILQDGQRRIRRGGPVFGNPDAPNQKTSPWAQINPAGRRIGTAQIPFSWSTDAGGSDPCFEVWFSLIIGILGTALGFVLMGQSGMQKQ